MKAALSCAVLLVIWLAAPAMFAQAQARELNLITAVKVLSDGPRTLVRVEGKGHLTFQTLRLHDPDRMVLDFANARCALAPSSIPSSWRPVRGVRAAQFAPTVARVVVDLERSSPSTINSGSDSVTIIFAGAVAGAPIAAEISHPPGMVTTARVSATPQPVVTTVHGEQPTEPTHRQNTALASAVAREEIARPKLSARNGLLTLHVKNQPLETILEQVGRQANVAIIPAEGLAKERISVDFEGYPVGEALRQMLQEYDVLLFYGAGNASSGLGSLKTVWVYPANRGPGIDRFSQRTWTAKNLQIERSVTAGNPEVRSQAVDSLIRREGHQSLGVVLDALKDPSAKVRDQALYRALFMGLALPEDTLIDLALNDESPDVRFLALQALPVDPVLRWVAERARLDSSQPVSHEAQGIISEYDSAGASPNASQP
jgi:hypothetical protein